MKIAITGAGIISAIGNNKEMTLTSLREGKSGIGVMRHLQSCHKELPVGEVSLTEDELKAMTGIAQGVETSRTTLLGIEAVRQALDEAKVKKQEGKRITFISGTTVAGMDITEKNFNQASSGEAEDYTFIRQHECGYCTEAIARHFGIFDECTTISTACSSAANAIALGARMLREGKTDIVVAGGAEALSRFHLNGFNSLMILDHEQCRPFDASRKGLNLGEGAGYIVMESEESAESRGVAPLAYVTGYGNACDAFHQTASSDDGEGAYLAMSEAIRMAGIFSYDIQYVNAHGTGTPSNDKSESAALRRVFGEALPCISSTKSATGHTTSASGGIETVICLIAMRHGIIPANIGWVNADAECITPEKEVTGKQIDNVMCNSFGFGGNDTSVIISRNAVDIKEPSSTYEVETAAMVTISEESELSEIRDYVKPMEARRMGKLAKGAMLSSLKALKSAGIDVPDAIVTATRFGCLENTERQLLQMKESGEEEISPTLFMQSTHNTIGSAIAIKLGCHGYNITYSHGEQSLEWAIRDAEQLIRSGKCKNVLVGSHDEMPEVFGELYEKSGVRGLPKLKCTAMVLRRKG